MGCIISGKSSSKKDIVHPDKKPMLENFSPKAKGIKIIKIFLKFLLYFLEIKRKEDVDFSTADLVGEKTGKITKDYTILNPPLGKGSKKFLFIYLTY